MHLNHDRLLLKEAKMIFQNVMGITFHFRFLLNRRPLNGRYGFQNFRKLKHKLLAASPPFSSFAEDKWGIKLLGLPLAQSNFVLNVKKGMILFLFEFERRQLHGVFRATSNGEIDIEPNAFKSSGKSFPAQVRFAPVWKCNPLSEHEFKAAIKENYFSWKKFNFGLSKDQVYRLVTLFHSKRIPKKPSEGDARRFGDYRNTIRDRVREDEVKEIDDQGYKYNRIQDEYNVINSFDRGYFGHNERVEREERTLTEQHPQYEPRGTDYDEDFGFGDVNVTFLSHINQNNSDFIPISQVSSEQFQHPFNIGNTYESCLPYLTSGDPSVITLHTPYNPEVPDFCHRLRVDMHVKI
ncbi:unnamed protein product [Lactuca virosa]|uniref:DCD domain-containing protein n=1 Tax=Lactuca virosa TaxID=75947 RepID=A0AAU9NFW5_9ASTR|nr:unnamed protein product [Lactuca virosa]